MDRYISWTFWIVFGIVIGPIYGKSIVCTKSKTYLSATVQVTAKWETWTYPVRMPIAGRVGKTSDCSKSLESCLRCDETGVKCFKCKHLIVFGTRNCVKNCPMGYTKQWSTYDDYMGQICVETSFATSLGFTGETSAVLVGSLSGLILCLGALLGGCIYVRRRRIKALASMDENSDSTMIMTPLHQQEKGEFLREISLLRHEAPVFLSMLNETRRQVREISKTKMTIHKRDAAIYAYRPVLRDLYVILILLNKPEESISVPPQEWRKLLSWGERVLKRYKRQHNIDTPVGQLVTLLDVAEEPNATGSHASLFQPYSTLSTVSTNTLTSTVSRKLKNALSHKNGISEVNDSKADSLLNEGIIESNMSSFCLPTNPLSEFNFSNLNRISYSENNFDNWEENHTILAEWTASQEYSFEDDFIRLGFRPQDEITTEL